MTSGDLADSQCIASFNRYPEPGHVNRATVHATVSEFWHILSGEGQIWRRDGTGEETTDLGSGVSIDIPVGTAFQYRCAGVDPLQCLCISPRWT
jgi:mannose-6-phosphate isomerase-like protein (cupin superfamily)